MSRLKSRFYQLSLIAVLALSVMSLTSRAQDEAQPLTIDDIMAMQSVGSPQVSPDGLWVAYTVRRIDMEKDKRFTQIWMVSTEGGDPIPMTSADSSASQPRWKPDNTALTFVASRGEDAKSQVWSLNRLGGEAIAITDVEQGISGYEWSPDGSRLMLVIKDQKPELLNDDEDDDKKPKPYVLDRIQFKRDYAGYLDHRRNHIYVYTPGDEAPKQLTFGDYDDNDAVWSPDGKTIAFTSDRSEEPDSYYGNNVYTVSADSAEPVMTKVTADTGTMRDPAWSPDGKLITYTSTVGPDVGGSALTPTQRLSIAAVDGSEQRVLSLEMDRSVSRPEFTADGSRIRFRLEDEGKVQYASIGADGRGFMRDIAGDVRVSTVVEAGGQTVVLMGDVNQPSEIYKVTDDGMQQLTFEASRSLENVARPRVEKLSVASADGTPVDAFYVYPLGYEPGQRYPTILWLHGGPASQFTFSYSATAQLFAANGYAVIMPNPRGSTGYGEAFAKGTVGEWGVKDVEDVLAAVDYGIEMGLVDGDRLGVGGWSYGGILTNYVITQTQRFKAASSGASLGLVASNYGHDQYQLMYELEFGLPWENKERWDALSPFYKVDQITTPTQWMCGEVDWNVPVVNSEQMYLGMKRLGRETELIVYPDEHHGIRKPTFVKDRYERWIAWFDQYLKG